MELPHDYIEWMKQRVRHDVVERFVAGLQEPSPSSIRINPLRLPSDAVPEGFAGRVPWCREGCYLNERPSFTADPLLHAGAYYVQEASSMFLAYALRQLMDECGCEFHSAIDLCAAPGGKTTLLRSVLPPDCTLVANEALPRRAVVLAENVTKWGAASTLVTNAYPAEFTKMDSAFDLVVADVPCSGEGMFRKEPDAVTGWSVEAVNRIAELQRSIITDIWPALQPGGTLIYSTCTLNPLEDEDNADWIATELGADIIGIATPAEWNILGDCRTTGNDTVSYHHLLPGYVAGEGFFLAVLRKHGEAEPAKPRKGSDARNSLFARLQKRIKALPTDMLDDASAASVQLSLPDAIRYLQRETLVMPADTPRGLVQVAFQGQRLGLVKNLGQRANNLYPKEWRIRSQHLVPHTLFTIRQSTNNA